MDGGDASLFKALEEQDRRAARADFLSFYMRMTGFRPQPHHRLICKLLQAMEDDRIDRAMVFMPRRMAKSTLCTQLFPSWIMGRHPKEKIMSAVHTQHYAQKTGKIVRNLVRSQLYPFETTLAADSQAKDQWATTEGGEYNGFGLMGGSTHGNPASWLICDDLIKGRKMAMSEHMRDEAWETYKADLVSSLQGRKKILKVTTRWHMDDPAGRILPEDFDGLSGWYKDRETGERWYVLSIPAAAEHEKDPLGRKIGEYMWPEEFAQKFEAARRRGGYIWSALYQQRPSPEEGLMFTDEHISWYNPEALDMTKVTIYGASDYAVTEEAGATDPDYTVHLIFAVDFDLNVYLLDGWRGRTTADVWVKQMIRLAQRYKPLRWGEEQGQIIKGVGPFMEAMMMRENVWVDRVQLTSSVSKEQRAHALLGLAAAGKFFLPNKARLDPRRLALVEAFEKEIKQFPAGRHDDMVDAATLFGRLLHRIIEGDRPAAKRAPQNETLEDLFLRHERRRRNDED
jgi:predicted phage terminase large subunit-like protein